MLKEFKEFAIRGSFVDLAIGVIIGVAFGRVITSLVEDLLMPPIGLLMGDVRFDDLFINLSGGDYNTLAAAKAAGAATLNYGLFINTLLHFIIVMFAIFMMVKLVNKWKSEPVPASPTSRSCPFCVSLVPREATRCPHCTSELISEAI